MPLYIATLNEKIGEESNHITSLTGSADRLKQYIPIGLVNLVLKRINFNLDLFDTHTIYGVSYQVFKECFPTDHPCFTLYQWIQEAINDLDTKPGFHVKDLTLIICKQGSQEILGHYVLSFECEEDDKPSQPQMLDDQSLKVPSKMFQNLYDLSDEDKMDEEELELKIKVHYIDTLINTQITTIYQRSRHYVMQEVNREELPTDMEITPREEEASSQDESFCFAVTNNNISCLCKVPYEILTIPLIRCTLCGKDQHLACNGFKSQTLIRKPYVCYPCHKETGIKISDIRMQTAQNENIRFLLAITRLTSIYYNQTNESPQDIISLLPKNIQDYTCKHLGFYGLCDPTLGGGVEAILNLADDVLKKVIYTESTEIGLVDEDDDDD